LAAAQREPESSVAAHRPLPPYLVLDLAGSAGAFCGRVLADLGAEVLKLESPGGDPARREPPFRRDLPSPDSSLPFWSANAGKLSVTLNVFSADGRALLLRLVEQADFLIESFPPGRLDATGLGYAALNRVNPRLVMVSISPFGQTGPHAGRLGGDLIAMAAGGLLYISGDSDRPPVRIGVPQSVPQAGLQAAVGALIAHRDRRATGQGQHIDLSTQEAIMATLDVVPMVWAFQQENVERGARTRVGPVFMRSIWRCADGYVSWRWAKGAARARRMAPIIDWMKEDSVAAGLDAIDWDTGSINELTDEEVVRWEEAFARFFLRHTRAELFERALADRLFLMRVNTVADLVADPQLAARGFFAPVEQPDGEGSARFPGPLYTGTGPRPAPGRPPRLGEHNLAIYCDRLGLSRQELAALYAAGIV
jgi:benzylsuccinate CoA-transferase BbsE subunit